MRVGWGLLDAPRGPLSDECGLRRHRRELVKHFRSWNYNDAMIPPQLLAWYKSNLGMTAGIGESKGDEPGRPVMRARATKKAFKEFLWGSRRDLPPTEDEVYHPGEWDGERFTCCLRTHDDDPGCTDVASQGRYCGGLKPGDRVTVGPEWAHFDDPGDPTSTVAADGTRRQPFGSVESATKVRAAPCLCAPARPRAHLRCHVRADAYVGAVGLGARPRVHVPVGRKGHVRDLRHRRGARGQRLEAAADGGDPIPSPDREQGLLPLRGHPLCANLAPTPRARCRSV